MARKKPIEIRVTAIRVLVSFNGMYAGDMAAVVLDDQVQGWINAGLVERLVNGESQAGPGAAESDDQGGVAVGAEGDRASGGEPGEGFGAGGYGAFAG